MNALRVTPRGQLSLQRVGVLLVQATGAARIADDEFRAYLRLVREDFEANGAVGVSIQYSPAQSPTSAQRKQVVDEVRHLVPFGALALVTGSPMARGAIAAIRWFTSSETELRAFSPGHEGAALAWLRERAEFDLHCARRSLRRAAVATGHQPPGP